MSDIKSSENVPWKKAIVFDEVDDYYESNSTPLTWSSSGVLEYAEKLEQPPSKKLKIVFSGKSVTAKSEEEEVGFDHYHETSGTNVSSLSNVVVERCPICKKVFSSKKAVHGHMRCHSDRSYRGMDPPDKSSRSKPGSKSKAKPITFTACADDQVEVAGCSGSGSGSSGGYWRSNLSWLPSWPSEVKRRRTSGGGGTGLAVSNSSVNCAEKKEEEDEKEEEDLLVSAVYSLKSLLATRDERLNKDGIRVSRPSNMEDVEGKKKVKENDGKVSMEGASRSNYGAKAASSSRLHVCKECNKAFESGQALGGHMRFHYKPPAADVPLAVAPLAFALPVHVLVVQSPIAHVVAKDQLPVPAILEDQASVADDVAKDQAPRVRCFDLNEMASDYDC